MTTAPDLAAVKARQQAAWSTGDYSAIAAQVQLPSEMLCEHLDLHAGMRVLDVACGSGNTSLPAARRNCDVVGIDYVPALLDRARERAAAERTAAEFIEADAEKLPFDDASFDAVVSVLGVMFAPDQEQAAAEMLRVCRPGGVIGIVVWPTDDFVHDLFKTVAAFAGVQGGVRSPFEWASEERLEELLGGGTTGLAVTPHTVTFSFRSVEDFVLGWTRDYGPSALCFGKQDADGKGRLRSSLEDLAATYNRNTNGPAVVITARYIEIVATRA